MADGDDAALSALMFNMAQLRMVQARHDSLSNRASGSKGLLLGADSIAHYDAAVGGSVMPGLTAILRAQILTVEGDFAAAMTLFESHLPAELVAGLARYGCSLLADLAWCRVNQGQPELALLQALEASTEGAPVLLVDELDRTDEAFEAFLLEILSDFQVTIPELGTIKAEQAPIVIITSNRTREVHDALKRRCLYHWVDYPDAQRELDILRVKAPGAPQRLTQEIVAFVQSLRSRDLFKQPGVAETIDWAGALTELDVVSLDASMVSDTLGVLLKYQDDIQKLQGGDLQKLIDAAKASLGSASAG